MAEKFSMTWNETGKRWFKKLDGKQHAVTAGKLQKLYPELCGAETRSGTWRAANAWWASKLLEATTIKVDQHQLDLAEAAELVGDTEGAEAHRARAYEPDNFLNSWNTDAGRAVNNDRLANLKKHKAANKPTSGQTIEDCTKLYLAWLLTQGAKPGTYSQNQDALRDFVNCIPINDPKKINAMKLIEFQAEFCKLKLAESTVAKRLAIVRKFVQWLWECSILDELPRNLRSIKIKVTNDSMYVPFTGEELQTIMDESNDLQKLHWLLMLNCGFNQIDIAKLNQHEVDWVNGRIKRQRSKTGRENRNPDEVERINATGKKQIPTVNWKLWPETFRLLKKFRSSDPKYVLLTPKGKPYIERDIKTKADGVMIITRRDPIGLNFRRLRDRLGLKKPLKAMRDTAASMLAKSEFSSYAQHFLGHSPRDIAGKHYITPSVERFDMAMEWLGDQFPFSKGAGKASKATSSP